jgi:hypothetical protein
MTANAMLHGRLKEIELKSEPAVLLNVIPDACNGKQLFIAAPVRIGIKFELRSDVGNHPEFWMNSGSRCFTSTSANDHLRKFVPNKILSASFMNMNSSEENVNVLHRSWRFVSEKTLGCLLSLRKNGAHMSCLSIASEIGAQHPPVHF